MTADNQEARLEIEIHQEKVKVWVNGASSFLQDERNQALVVDVVIKALDKWLELHKRKVLERLGLYALGAIVMTFLAILGWKGWGK